MASFPSVEWFDDVRYIFNNEESFRGVVVGSATVLPESKLVNTYLY